MGPTVRRPQPIYLDDDKRKLLDELSAQTRIPKAVLMREAIDDLLIKYGKFKPPSKSTSDRTSRK